MVSCKFCSKQFKSVQSLKTHLSLDKKCSVFFKDDFDWLSLQKDEAVNYTCRFCGKVFNSRNCCSNHIKVDVVCNKKFLEEKELATIEGNKRPKVVCMVCGVSLRNISNTHLKTHGITQEQYKSTYIDAPIFADGLLSIQRNNRESTLKKRYTQEEIKFFKGKKGINTKLENSTFDSYTNYLKNQAETFRLNKPEQYLQYCEKASIRLRNFYENLSDEDLRILSNKKEKTCLEKYGYSHVAKVPSFISRILKTKEERYGKTKYRLDVYRQTMLDRYGKYSNFFPHFSLASQILFLEIEDILVNQLNFLPTDIYFATNGIDQAKSNEFQVCIGNDFVRFLDFYIPSINKWIEFDEKHHFTEKMLEADSKREKEILSKLGGVKLIRIKEEDYLKDSKFELEKCIDFLRG